MDLTCGSRLGIQRQRNQSARTLGNRSVGVKTAECKKATRAGSLSLHSLLFHLLTHCHSTDPLPSAMGFVKNHLFSNFEAPVVDLSGKTVIVTGPTVGGLGYETAVHYAKSGVARLILASRNMTRLQDAERKIRADLPSFKGQIETWQLDQGKFESVRAFSDRMDGLDRLDVVVFNAGVAHFSGWDVTEEGYEDTCVGLHHCHPTANQQPGSASKSTSSLRDCWHCDHWEFSRGPPINTQAASSHTA